MATGETVDEGTRPLFGLEDRPLAILREASESSSQFKVRAPATGAATEAWRLTLFFATYLGLVLRSVVVHLPGLVVPAALMSIPVLLVSEQKAAAAYVGGAWVVVIFVAARWRMRGRFLVGRFSDHTGVGDSELPMDLGNLFVTELSSLSDLFRVVGDRRVVSTDIGPASALDPTLSVTDGNVLEGALVADATMKLGPATIPLAPLFAIAGKFSQAPRLTGDLHRDGSTLILTAQLNRRRGATWQISSQSRGNPDRAAGQGIAGGATNDSGRHTSVTTMVEHLALRVFTDVALERGVRWEASHAYVEGLRRFRSCLRTPKERKVNLKDAERLFLQALAEDEDLPFAYYNLGVVYSELYGLAIASGHDNEADMHLRAAETCFGRAIEKEPLQWTTYFALAQTQLQYGRYDLVVRLCERIDHLQPWHSGWGNRAKALELKARALRGGAVRARGQSSQWVPGDPALEGAASNGSTKKVRKQANKDLKMALDAARRGCWFASWSLLGARLARRGEPGAETDREPSCAHLAATCAQTFGITYATQLRGEEARSPIRILGWWQDRARRRTQGLFRFARTLSAHDADVRFRLGMYALGRGRVDLAMEEIQQARRGDPTRPAFAAGLALACTARLSEPSTERERRGVRVLCQQALRGMAEGYSPLRDTDVWEMIALAYKALEDSPPTSSLTDRTADKSAPPESEQIGGIGETIATRLREGPRPERGAEKPSQPASAASTVSSLVLEQMERASSLAGTLGPYTDAMRDARRCLRAGQKTLGDQKARTTERGEAFTKFKLALEHAEHAASLNPLSASAWEMLRRVRGAIRLR